MLFKALVFFPLITAVIGIYQVEQGAYAWSVDEYGYENGATLAFLCYAFLMLGTVFLVTRGRFFLKEREFCLVERSRVRYTRIFLASLVVNLLLMLIFYVITGAHQTLLGLVAKGEFRSSLGNAGIIAYMITKWLSPVLLAYNAALLLKSKRVKCTERYLFVLFILNSLVVFLIGLGWGFKGTSLVMLAPAMILLSWYLGFLFLLKFAIFASVVIVGLFTLFDSTEGTLYVTTADFLWARLTVMQGDVSWYLWSRHVEQSLDYEYMPTLTVFVGDRLWSLFTGITRDSPEAWVLSHYGSLLTYAVGYPVQGILDGHSVAGAPFSEGLIAGGAFGAFLFAILSGAVIGFVYKKISNSIREGQCVYSAIWSTYFVFAVFAWLNGGEIVQIFHVSVLISIFISLLFVRFVNAFSSFKRVKN